MEMTKSDSISALAGALAKAQGEFNNVKKDADNPFFKSKYADLAANVEAARKVLTKHGLSVSQLPGFNIKDQALVLTTILMHESGEFLAKDFPMPVMDMKAQSVGSALTYARRYALQAILGLAAEDDDGNAASGNHGAHEQEREAPRQSKPAPELVKSANVRGDIIEGVVQKINQRRTAKGSDSWGFLIGDKWWNTFDKRVGSTVKQGEKYTFQLEQKGQYTNIVGLIAAEELQEPEQFAVTDDDIPF